MTSTRPFAGFGRYWWAHRLQWLGAGSGSLIAVASGLAVPRLLGRAIDVLRAGGPLSEVASVALGMLTATAISALAYVAMRRLAGDASRQISYEVRRDIFHRLTELEPAYFHRNRTGDLMSRLTGDLSAVQELIGFGQQQGLTIAATVVLALVLMVKLSWRMGLVVVAVFPPIALLLFGLLRVIGRRYAATQEQASTISAMAQENFSGIRVVKGYAAEDRELAAFRALNDEYRRRVLSLARVEGPLWAVMTLAMSAVYALVLLIGARQLLHPAPGATMGALTLGGFVTFTTYLFQLSWPVVGIGLIANIFNRGQVSWSRLRELLDATPQIATRTDALDPGPIRGELRFDDVSVELGGRRLLDHLSLTVLAGRTLGITGRTGSGKSLLAALIGRLLDPTSGRVLLDGHDLRALPLEAVRGAIGVVPQEPFLFSDALAQNIGFGLAESLRTDRDLAPEAERIEWAARLAGLSSDVQAFPEAYQTVIGERGVTLSGGQRQRTALARAIAKQPRVLLLDDAMSAVDTETEANILSGLRQLLGGRTVILISHRVSTLRQADEIVVLDAGRIIEQGTHEALLARGGVYAQLERRQRLAEQLAAEPAPEARS